MNWYKASWINEKALQNLQNYNFEIVEHIELEGYDLVLTKGPNYFRGFDNSDFIYQMAIQQEDSDFTDPKQQMSKKLFQIPKAIKLLSPLKNTVRQWVGQYGRLYIGSLNTSKNPKYMNILKWFGFNIQKVPPEYDFMNSGAMYIE